MSSSTYITESWIHMQQHGFIDEIDNKIKPLHQEKKQQPQQPQQQQQQEGKYARSTASSRSRALLNKEIDSGMSQSGIYEAFAEADKWEKKATTATTNLKKYNNETRRKSTTTVEVKKSPIKTMDSPRLRYTSSTAENQSKLNTGRRQTLSGALTSTNNNNNNTMVKDEKKHSLHSNGGGLVKLADTLRDTLAAERRLARQELGLCNTSKPVTTTNTTRTQQQGQNPSVVDIISSAKRRSSMTKEKLRTLDQPRRRTLSSGAAILTQPQKVDTNTTTTTNTGEASYMKSTLADQQRRHSVTNSPSLNSTRVSSASPRRKNSILSKRDESSPSFTSEDENSIKKPSSALKRRSILAAATAKARQQQQQQQQQTDLDVALNSSSGDEKSILVKSRLRKKSFGVESPIDADSILANRRMSRTESLKEGVPTSPSAAAAAARMTRRKSVNKADTAAKRCSTIVVEDEPPKKNTVRKRGKTLPGNLAKPPTVQSLQLPPMKVEPIKLNLPPKTTTPKKMVPKSPSIRATNTTSTNRLSLRNSKKRLSLCSTNTTPIPISSSSSSSAEATSSIVTPPKKSLSTRKAKGASHLGISTSRRASLKAPTTSSQIVSPSPKNSPISAASPRVRPHLSRRQSLAGIETKQTVPVRSEDSSQDYYATRKLSSSAYSSSSRKNSLVDDLNVEKDKGRHRAISLREKLEAMVAQHAIHEDKNLTSAVPSPGDYVPHRTRNKSLSYDDERYTQLLTAEERARPQRIKDTLMMWDKEMVEAFSPGIPKSPSIAMKFYGHHLSPYEQNEIQAYPEIYFVGHHAKKHQAMPDSPALNYGYDDERGDYKSVINDHLGYRYEILEELGRGSFGQVVKCYDHKTASTVAVKLIRNKKRFYAQAKTEVKILSDLVKWDPEDRHHNVKMTDSFYFRNHLCIACECLSMNLYEFIKVNNFQGFHITLIKRFTVQLLRSLSLLSRHGVVHCDLKPENILLKHPTKSTIKVIDFGSSCLENQRVYTYIQSRFYRSPEIILGLDYTMAIDMWSLGCIIGELYTGVPIFPGENEQEQLACIMEVLGVPDPELIQLSERRHLFFDRRGEPKVVCNSRGKKRRAGTKNLAQALRCNDALFLDFIHQCLEWDPSKRLTPEKAFQHEWILQSTRPTAIRNVPAASPNADDEEEKRQSSSLSGGKFSPKPTSATVNDTSSNNYA